MDGGLEPHVVDAHYLEGLKHHQAGRLNEARDHYQRVLTASPRHFDALHMLGVFAIQSGQLGPAVELIQQAISVRSDEPGAFGNLGNALNSLGRHEEALAASDKAIALNAGFAQAHGNRGQALLSLKRFEEALTAFNRVVELKPTPQAWLNQASVLRDLGRLEAALESCDCAIALKPDYAEALRSRGVILGDLGRLEEGLETLDRAAAARPGWAQVWCDRGLALRRLGRAADALASQDRALELQPNHVEAMCGRVGPLRELQRLDEALVAAEGAIALKPDHPQAHNVRGVVLYDLRRLDEALDCFDRALALDPTDAKTLSNRGLVLYELRRLAEAMVAYDSALAAQPEFADAQHNQAMCRLMLGDHEAGWAQYEWRWRVTEMRAERRKTHVPAWTGAEALAQKRVLLWAEQGLGDTLQFCRYAGAVAALGAEVILEVQPGLERLAARLDGVSKVVARGQATPEHDFQIPLMSLPRALRAGVQDDNSPYLRPESAAAAAWAQRLGVADTRRVGLCWAGGTRPGQFIANNTDKRRSLPLAAFAPLAAVDGVDVYSLQKGSPSTQRNELEAAGWSGPRIIDFTAEMKDFHDTAAFVANLDLVITCDTAVAHLAGGLGKPVWILNRFDACWRWLDGRDDTPWYPSARLFRQPVPGDWTSVIETVVAALSAPWPG